MNREHLIAAGIGAIVGVLGGCLALWAWLVKNWPNP